MSQGLTHILLFTSLLTLKELAASHLPRTPLLCPGFPTSLAIPLLVLIQRARKLVDILILKFLFLLLSFLVRVTKRRRRLRCILFFTIFKIHVHSLIMNKIFLSISIIVLYIVFVFCVFEIQSGFVIFPKRGRLLSCIPCFSLFLLSCFVKILKPSLNLFFPCLCFG